MMHDMEKRLKTLAGADAARLAVLEGRKARSKTRMRRITCPACNETEYSNCGPTDICEACLVDLWGARNVLAGAYDATQKSGLRAVALPGRHHDIEYPYMSTNHEHTPKKASFARGGSFERTESTSGTMQILYSELLTALSEVLPCDPTSRNKAERLLPGSSPYDNSKITAQLPAGAIKALRDLWGLMIWHSAEAYQQGFSAGHDLLGRMNLGGATFEQFQDDVAKQVERTRANQKKIAAGLARS